MPLLSSVKVIAVMQQTRMTMRQQRRHMNDAVPTSTLLTKSRSTTSVISQQVMLFLQANYSCTAEGVITRQFSKASVLLSEESLMPQLKGQGFNNSYKKQTCGSKSKHFLQRWNVFIISVEKGQVFKSSHLKRKTSLYLQCRRETESTFRIKLKTNLSFTSWQDWGESLIIPVQICGTPSKITRADEAPPDKQHPPLQQTNIFRVMLRGTAMERRTYSLVSWGQDLRRNRLSGVSW